MYQAFWQLQRKPFDTGADPRFYFPAHSHQAALLKLRYAIESGRSGTLLAGPAGTGKTLLVAILKATARPAFLALRAPGLPADDRRRAVGLSGRRADRLADRVEMPICPGERAADRAFRGRNVGRGRHAVVAVDESHLLDDPRTLESLRLLLNFESAGQSGLTLILVGQTGLLPLLERMPQFEQRLAVKCLLRALSPQETAEYVSHRLKVAGAETMF